MAIFTFTQDELNSFINNSQCCLSSKVDNLINLKNIGDDSYDSVKAECLTLDVMLRAISVDIATEVCLCQKDFDYIFEQINKSCCNCC